MTVKKRWEIIVWGSLALLTAIALASAIRSAHGQAWAPPYCYGANRALQFNEQGWVCVTIQTMPLPAQPPISQCITANWDGSKWNCVATQNLTTGLEATVPSRR